MNDPTRPQPSRYNYDSYGAYKATRDGRNGRFFRWARALGLQNRYLKFLRAASKELPLLEIGCGDGHFLEALSKAGFKDIKGVEPSRSYQSRVDDGLIIHCFASEYLETCAPGSLGTVVALDVFEHVPSGELRKLLHTIRERLVPNGVVMLRVPNMASPLGLLNFFGDLSHTTPLNEVSIVQLMHQAELEVQGIYSEPFAYPSNVATVAGILLWPMWSFTFKIILSAFGVRAKIVTPNVVCVAKRPP
jgi:2-polyprenyl-3-methyl-5-hydroxy-6-metoxy-1,4-benzoquinol methylase